MRHFTDGTLEAIAERFKVLGEPTRLQLLNLLREGERSVSDLTGEVPTTQANVSRHLAILRRHDLVERRKDGVTHRYRIADPSIFRLCDLVCGSIEANLDERREEITGGG